ncbi:MAG: hypothetical protein KDC38_17675, partial [Planctomycetes bacterium]|nr:hypothetical protein [Planctomycetota bacterium]
MPLREEMERQGDFLFRYRSHLPWLLAPCALYALWNANEIDGSVLLGYQIVGVAVIVVGLALRALTVGYVPKRTSGRSTKGARAASLNTEGSYSTVRHPLYVANYICFLGLVCLIGQFWFVGLYTAIFWIYYERIMLFEEAFLRRKFGEDYESWASRTPTFVPRVRAWRRPT